MAINWSTLGANIPSQYSKDYQEYNLNPDAFSKGMESIGNVFDRYGRENALGKSAKQKIDSKLAEIRQLEARLDELKAELEQAKNSVPSMTSLDVLGVPEDSTLGKILTINGYREYQQKDPTFGSDSLLNNARF